MRGEDSDDPKVVSDGDPNLEEEAEDAEALSEVASDSREFAAAFSGPENEIITTCRYCASFGDIRQNTIHLAAESMPNHKVDSLTITGL